VPHGGVAGLLPGGFARLSGGEDGGVAVMVRFCEGRTGTLDCAATVDTKHIDASDIHNTRALMVPP
jgi:hypothetical protein